MAQESRAELDRLWHQHIVDDDVASNRPWLYACPCQGIPPMIIESPLRFFGSQLVVGLGSTMMLLLIEVLR